MKAIIPTAGKGKRMRPFTHSVPKVLLQVADKPILGHILDKLLAAGVDEVAFVVGYLGDKIEEYVKSHYPDLKAHFVVQEEARGLGHAIYLTHEVFGQTTEPVLTILGDTILEADLSRLQNVKEDQIGVCEVEDPRRFGVVELENGAISAMVEKPEKPKTNLAIVGIYYLHNMPMLYECLRHNMDQGILTKGEVQLTDALQAMLGKGCKMEPFPIQGWYDCGKPETLLATNRTLLEERFMDVEEELRLRFPGIQVKPPVYVGPGAKIESSIIGPHVSISADSAVHNSIVSNSIVNAGAGLQNVILNRSIIGEGAVVKNSALRLCVGDNSEVTLD